MREAQNYSLLRTIGIQSMQSIHTFFDQIYLLCPQPDAYRKLMILQKLQRLQIPALIVQGDHETPPNSLYRQILFHANQLQHRSILILRDDIIFHKDFHQQFEDQASRIPHDWKLLHLGAHQFPGITGDEQPARKLGAFAVGLHRSTFQGLLSGLDRILGNIDAVHFQHIIQKHPAQCFSFQPQLVLSALLTELEAHKENFQAYCQQLNWDIQAYDYPFQPDLLSIIMPVFNRAGVIEKAIRSSLRQSYVHFELIVIDDASSDNSRDIVRSLMTEDQRIRLIERKENGGVGLARNEGIRQAKGRFIAFHDSDDIMLQDRLLKQLLPFYEKAVLFTLARVIRSHCQMAELQLGMESYNLELARSRTSSQTNGIPIGDDGIPIGDERERAYPATAIFRRDVFERWGLYWDVRYAEDIELIERILYHQAGIHFGKREEMPIQYIEDQGFISDTVALIPEVLCIATKRKADNLTTAFKKQEQENQAFLQLYRDRLLGKGNYIYPQLKDLERSDQQAFLKYERLQSSKAGNLLQKMEASLSWRITRPLRILGKLFMK